MWHPKPTQVSLVMLRPLIPGSSLERRVQPVAPIIHRPDRQLVRHRPSLHREVRTRAHAAHIGGRLRCLERRGHRADTTPQRKRPPHADGSWTPVGRAGPVPERSPFRHDVFRGGRRHSDRANPQTGQAPCARGAMLALHCGRPWSRATRAPRSQGPGLYRADARWGTHDPASANSRPDLHYTPHARRGCA
jgi:hypothetical protein